MPPIPPDPTAGGPPAWRPHPWVAAALSVPVSGLGHLYAGRPPLPALGVWLAGSLIVVVAAALSVVVPGPATRLVLLALAIVAPLVLVPAHALRTARETGPRERAPYQRPVALAALLIGGFVVGRLLLMDVMRRHVVEAFRIPAPSMAPTLLAGDYLFVSRIHRRPPARGDIVVYRRSEDGASFIHRVVGLPGDTLAMSSFRLSRNGAPAAEPYARLSEDAPDLVAMTATEFDWQLKHRPAPDRAAGKPSYGTWGPLVVPEGSLFLLGDARDNSADSRHRGFTALGDITGRPAWVYFSRDPEDGTIRWRRIGRRVQR